MTEARDVSGWSCEKVRWGKGAQTYRPRCERAGFSRILSLKDISKGLSLTGSQVDDWLPPGESG